MITEKVGDNTKNAKNENKNNKQPFKKTFKEFHLVVILNL